MNRTHGLSKHPLHRVWSGMKARCYRPTHVGYKYYGARNIRVCDEWLNDLPAFIEWATANGWSPELQIDRINNDGDYCPANCRFVTAKVNANNRRLPSAPHADKKSGLPLGVAKHESRFQAIIRRRGQHIYLGRYNTPEEAAEMYRFADRQIKVYESP